jgi:parallel beta-helix repeat protein
LFLFNMTNTHMVAANAQYSEVWLCQTTNATLNNVTISNSMYPSDGLVLDHAINNTVINSNFSYDYIGAWVNGWDGTSYYTGATDNYIANNVMSSESYGIKQESIRNTLAGNNISNCSWGIYFTGSYYGRSLFANNTIRYNTEGIYGSAGYANLVSNLIDRNMWGARGFGGNATYNVVSNNNNTGLSISGGNISNNIAYNNTLGITGGIIFVNNTVYNNTIGIQGAGASIFFNNATNNNHGILVRGYSYVSNNTVVNNVYGINATTDNTNNRIHNNLVVNNSYGISVGYSNNITNNTLISNGYGLSILGDSNNVYYNYFYNSTILHARAVQSNPFAAQANYFNTSSNASGIREAQGNYWDDIKKKGLDIIDTNYNIWADSGTQYPYNISNGGNVSTYVTDWGPIVDPLMVYASDIRCEVDGTTWIPCNNLAYDNNLTRVRVNCTDLNGGVVNATFNLTNVADSATKFYASNATEYQGALWIYDNPDLIIKDGGTWNIRAVCINALGQRQNNSANWTLPWGTLVPSIGIGNMNVIKNVPFTFNVSVQCSGGECGNINATADPEQQVWTPSNKSSNNMSASSICYFDMGCPGYRCPDSGFCYMDLPSCQSACGGSCPSPASGSRCGGASVHDTTFSPPWFDYNAGTCGGVYPNTGEYIKMTSGAFSGSCYSISSSSYPTCWGSYPCIQVSGSVSVSDCFDVYSSNCGAGGGGNPNATIVGNSSDVQTSGIANLNVTINGTKLNENITGVNLVAFFDGNTKLVDFNWNFTNSSILNMSSINITKTARGIYIQGVGVAKTIYANPGSVVEGICIKNADGVVANAKSCNGTGEKLVYSAGCNGTLVNVSGDWVNCTLNGTTYVLGGLSHSGGEPMSKGIIPMTSGTPFYTTTSNPYTCSAMYKGDSCAVSWTVMPTGDANTTWIFFAIANATQYLTISPAQTDTVNITILYDLIPPNITIIRPANGTITNMTAINFTAVLSDALSGLKNATLYIYNQTGLYNMSFFNLGGVANAIVSSIVNLAAGTYSWFWEVFDIVENMASTSVLYGNYTLRVDTSSPNYDNLSAMPASPTSYSYGQAYSFNATWTDDVDVDSVFIEFNGTVYTPNDLGSGIYNFGVVDLAAGNYSYRWSANDTAGNANYTDLLIYEIQKAATTTNVITQPTSPITYGTASNFSCYNSALLPMNLYVNGTNKTDEKGLSLTRAAGSYTVNCTSDDNENYTGGSEQINYLINRALQTAALVINETSPIAYDTYINATCNGEMFKNDANVTGEISSAVLLGAGSYNYSCKLYESENYSYDDDNMTFVVNQFAPNLTISILPSSSVTDGTITNVSGTGCPAQINCTLYMDGVNVSNPDVTMLAAGTYNYSYETPGNENYTIANVSAVLTVTTITPPGPGPGPTPCTEDSWTPSNSSICNGKSFTQTSNCGRIRTVTGISNGTDWTCGNWTACITNTQSRECISECSITRNESRACQCIPLWNCTEWSRCVNSTNARTCEDMNNCGIGQGRPNESESCGQQHGCAQNFICGEWSGCDYQNRVDDIINGKLTYEGIRHRVCADILSSCADNYTDYENCTSNETLELKKEEICGKEMLTAVNTKTGAPVTRIDIESWKSNRLDVAFIQKEVVYCPDCYNGLRDGSETGIDCGGNCRACKPESKLPIALLNWMLWILAAILVVPILKISRSDDDLLEQIKALIKSGEQALAKEDRKKAANNFREMKWLYVQIESKRKKRAILKAIQKYHRKIRSFYEL